MRSSSDTKPQADSAAVSLEFFHAGKLHDCGTNIGKTFSSQIGASDVFDVGPQVYARVLLRISKCSWYQLVCIL
jgi:hypothetical protein